MSGAVVEVVRQGTTDRSTKTDNGGLFRLEAAAQGSYELRVTHPGFKVAVARVRVGNRPPAPIRVVLKVADLQEQVTVNGAANQVTTEAAENRDVSRLDTKSLESLPIFDQDYLGTMARFLDPSAAATGGLTIVVDGVEMPSIPGSFSTIQEVKINNNPYSAEYSRPGRGRIEIITKPGSSQYHGTANFVFRDARLNARDPFALVRPGEQRRIFEGNVTGPLGSGKTTSFMVSANREEDDVQATVYAIGPGGEIRETVPSPSRVTQITPRITHQSGEKSLFSIWYVYLHRSTRNQGVGGFVLPEAAADYDLREDEVFFSHRWTLTPTVLNQFRFLVARYDTPTRSINTGPRIVVLDAFTGGGAQADQLRTERHFALHDIVSWSQGRHLIKTGLNIPDFSRRGYSDHTNQIGTFYFSSLPDYLAGRPFSLLKQAGDGHLAFIEKLFGGFVQDDLQLSSNLSISAGLRYDWQNYFHDHNNFSPRLSLAYAPGRSRKTVLRTGAGVFYDRSGPLPISDLLRFNGVRLKRYVIEDPGFPDPLAPGSSFDPLPVSVVVLDPHVRMPYTVQYSFAVERQLQKSTTLTASYFGSTGVSLFRSRDINAPLPPVYAARPNVSFGQRRQIEASGRSESDSFEVGVRGNLSQQFTGVVQYTLGRAYNDTGGINAFPADNYNLRGEWARADFDQRHRFDVLGTIRPRRLFNLGLSAAVYSGRPYNITTGLDANRDGIAGDRPPGVARNTGQGPAYADVDIRWTHDFALTQKKEKGAVLTAGLDAFNVINKVNYLTYVGNLSSPFYGRPVAALAPRRLQVLLRFKF